MGTRRDIERLELLLVREAEAEAMGVQDSRPNSGKYEAIGVDEGSASILVDEEERDESNTKGEGRRGKWRKKKKLQQQQQGDQDGKGWGPRER